MFVRSSARPLGSLVAMVAVVGLGSAQVAFGQCAKPARLVRLHPPGWTAPTGNTYDPSALAHYLSIGSRFDLGLFDTGGSRDGIGQNGFAISETAEMAAAFIADGSPHALFWTPVTLGGVAANTAFDLHVAAGATMDDRDASVANDLATDRVVVGLAGDDAVTATRAWKWEVAVVSGVLTAVATDIHPSAADAAAPSVAYSIDEGSPALVVGNAFYECAEFQGPPRGFRELEDASGSILLSPPLGTNHTFAYAIDSLIGGAEAAFAPLSGPCGTGPDPTACETSADEDAIAWGAGSTPAASGYGPIASDPDIDTEVRDIIADERAVGHAFVGAFPACDATAVYWDSLASAAFDLGALEGDAQSRAEAIQPVAANGCGAIVGARALTLSDREAGLWCGSGSSWQAVPISGVARWDSDPETSSGGTAIACDLPADLDGPYGRWTIEELHDVNSYGQAIGTMVIEARESPEGPVVFVQREVIALTAVEDVDSSFHVDAADIAIILGAWGTGLNVPDVDGSGTVDATDLAIVLGAWSGSAPCTVHLCQCESPNELTEGGSASGSIMDAMNAAVAALGFYDADGLAAWSATASEVEVLGACEKLAMLTQEWLAGTGGGQ